MKNTPVSFFPQIPHDVNDYAIEVTLLLFRHRFSFRFSPICDGAEICRLDLRGKREMLPHKHLLPNFSRKETCIRFVVLSNHPLRSSDWKILEGKHLYTIYERVGKHMLILIWCAPLCINNTSLTQPFPYPIPAYAIFDTWILSLYYQSVVFHSRVLPYLYR